MNGYNYVPSNIQDLIKSNLNDDNSQLVLEEIDKTIHLEKVFPPMLDEGKTKGNWNTFLPNFTDDYRPSENLSYETIDEMLKSSAVLFSLEMKRSQIASPLKSERSWRIECSDDELRSVVEANLSEILPKMSWDFSYSAMVYGVSFQELIWERQSKYELGLAKQRFQQNKKFIVAKLPASVDPKTVRHIKRKKNGEVDGFVQAIEGDTIDVEQDAALIIPYNDKFRNLWGESFFKPIYPLWFWYEIILRAMVRFSERIGTPIAVVRAPSKSTVLKPGSLTRVDGMSWGMEIASNVSRSNAAVIPSDTDEQGKPLWELSYLSSTEKSQPFVEILELITQMILRAGLSADRSLSQSSGGVGSYNIGQIHQAATAIQNEMILGQWVFFLNKYFLPYFSLYNRGRSGPKISIETQGLDPYDRENLRTLFNATQQSNSFNDAANMIDWRTIFETHKIPTLSKEEAEAKKRELFQEQLDKQEAFMMNGPEHKVDADKQLGKDNSSKEDIKDESKETSSTERGRAGNGASQGSQGSRNSSQGDRG